MGLDSLMTVQLRDRLVEVLGVVLTPVTIFNYPTVNSLAAHVAALLGTRDGSRDGWNSQRPIEDESGPSMNPHASGAVSAMLDRELDAIDDLLDQGRRSSDGET